MNVGDLYHILGVSPQATEAEVRKSFHQLAKKYHPDMNPNNPEAELKFKEVNLAYEVLRDKKKRAHYDQMRALGVDPFAQGTSAGASAPGGGASAGNWQYRGGATPGQDFGLGDLFNEIFGQEGLFGFGAPRGAGGRTHTFRRARPGAAAPLVGADRHADLTLTFLEAVNGTERVLDLPDGRRLTVKIPAGVDSDKKMKLAHQGEPGAQGGKSGDLILTLRVLPDPVFTRKGDDIYSDLPLSFPEAVLGAEVEVLTITGPVLLKVPGGVSSGQKLKLAEKGVLSPKGKLRGDHYVVIQIKLPKPVPDAYREAAQAALRAPYHPRLDN